jgi:hypothetical protein
MDVRPRHQIAVRMTGGALICGSSVGLLLTTTAGLALWIVLWAIGVKAFDAFMITVLMIVVAAGVRVFSPYLPGNRSDEPERWTPR